MPYINILIEHESRDEAGGYRDKAENSRGQKSVKIGRLTEVAIATF